MSWRKGAAVPVLLLCVVLLFSACSNRGNESTAQPESKESGSSAPPTAAAQQSEPSPFAEKLTLNWFIPSPANAYLPEGDLDFVKKAIEDKFNVEMKITYMAGDQDYVAKLNTLLASTPPDMWSDRTNDGGQKYAADGLLADLTGFVIPDKMPNYYKYWLTEDIVQRAKINGQFVRAPLPYMGSSYRSYYIRQDWLDNLGLKMPTNYDEYVEVLRAFTNKDPDGNGKDDTYGFTTAGGGANLGVEWPEYTKNGIKLPTSIQNNAFVDGQTVPEIEGVLNDIVKLIDEKLVDPDWYLNKSPQHVEKAIQGRVGVVYGYEKDFAFDNNQQGIQYRTKQINPNANWMPMTIFANDPIYSNTGAGNPFLFSKSTTAENMDRSVAILDWLASEEGYLLTHYGIEGKHYTRDGDTITLNLDAFESDVVKQGDFLKIWSFFTMTTAWPEVYGLKVIDPRETDRDRAIVETLLAQPKRQYLGSSLIAPPGFDLAAFRKRQNELMSKAIFEDKSGKNWPQYREELLNKLNGTALYEAYTNNLKAAGVIK